MIADFDKNLPCSKYQSSSAIQRPDREAEKSRGKTNGSRRSQRMGGRENIK